MTGSAEPEGSMPRTLSRLGSELHFWAADPATAPVIVCSHGVALDHTAFDHQVDVLIGSGYRVVTWDLRGHGRSTPIGERSDVRTAADDLIAILDELGVGSATLVGHSFGGYVTQEATFRHADRVNVVVLVGGTDLSTPPSPAMRIARQVMPRLLPLLSVSYSIPVPVLLTHGAVDKANGDVFAKVAPGWAAKEPHATYATVPDAGHTANQDNPDAFNTLLLDFLAECIP